MLSYYVSISLIVCIYVSISLIVCYYVSISLIHGQHDNQYVIELLLRIY